MKIYVCYRTGYDAPDELKAFYNMDKASEWCDTAPNQSNTNYWAFDEIYMEDDNG